MIAIIDYKMGNIRSVENALRRLGAEYVLTDDRAVIAKADHVILPGVGHCGEAMHNLRERNLCQFIKDLRHPVLGICVGMQVMCRHTEEGDTDCLNLFDAHVRKFDAADGLKVPHMAGTTSPILTASSLKTSKGANMCISCIATMQAFALTR